jgi:hypothetical protein
MGDHLANRVLLFFPVPLSSKSAHGTYAVSQLEIPDLKPNFLFHLKILSQAQ